jgi:hypothetical protein
VHQVDVKGRAAKVLVTGGRGEGSIVNLDDDLLAFTVAGKTTVPAADDDAGDNDSVQSTEG